MGGVPFELRAGDSRDAIRGRIEAEFVPFLGGPLDGLTIAASTTARHVVLDEPEGLTYTRIEDPGTGKLLCYAVITGERFEPLS